MAFGHGAGWWKRFHIYFFLILILLLYEDKLVFCVINIDYRQQQSYTILRWK